MFNDLDIYRPRGIPAGALIDEILAAHHAAGRTIAHKRTRPTTLRENIESLKAHSITPCVDIILIATCLTLSLAAFSKFESGYTTAGMFFTLGVCVMIYLAMKKGKIVKKKLQPLSWNTLKKPLTRNYKKKYRYTATHNSGNKTVTLYPSITNPDVFVTEQDIHKEMNRAIHHMLNLGKLPRDIDTHVAGYRAFYGAVAELHTAHVLRDIPRSSVYNDISITLDKTHVTANIDHLIYDHNTKHTIMVDSKFLSQLPEFTDADRTRMIKTCLYEASFLPQKPYAIVFAVAGNASKKLTDNPIQAITYLHFDKHGNSVGQSSCHIPVFFVAQDELKEFVHTLFRNTDVPDYKKTQADPKKYIGKKMKRGKKQTYTLTIKPELDYEKPWS